MNIIYLGVFPPNFLIKRSDGKIDSLYRTSEAIIYGFRCIPNVNLHVITSPDIPSWPKGPLFVSHENNDEEKLTMVSSLNLSFIKQFWTILSMTIDASRIIRKTEGKTVVMIPHLVFRHVFTLRLLHFLYPQKVVQASIVPDIFFPKKWFSRQINSFTEYLSSKFDAFVLYTSKMADYLKLSKVRCIVIEGFRKVPDYKPRSSNEFKIIYAGSLNINYGVGRLVEAMSYIDDPEIQLHLYGSGSAENLITTAAKKDGRISFFGKVPHTVATDAIYSASALINPRNANDGDYTEYSFPSKDIEYMATGIPALLCKLPGMPPEYYGHFVDIGDGTPNQIAEAIVRIKKMTKEERFSIGKDARDFILSRMDSIEQVKSIVSLFERVLDM